VQVVVGRIGRPHGIRGEVTVEVRTDSPDDRFAPGSVLTAEPARLGPITVAAARWHSGRLLLSVAGVHDRTGAEALRGAILSAEIDADDVPEDPEEFYDRQLIGLTVVAAGDAPADGGPGSGGVIGVVGDVVHLPGQDLLSVQREGGREVLVPFVAEIVTRIDLDSGRISVDLPPGLLNLDELDEPTEPTELDEPAGPEGK
jgi:16S rRNA processing protein RimM